MKRRKFLLDATSLLLPGVLSATAAADESFLEPLSDIEHLPQEKVDVLVVGGGAGGLAAAVSAAEEGAGHVKLIEKQAKLGGDTLIAGGYFNAVIPERQQRLGIEDSVERFEAQILMAGQGANDPLVAHELAAGAGPALQWLETKGMTFLPEIFEVFGSGWRRCFKPVLPRGMSYLRALTAAAYSAGVQLQLSTAALAITRLKSGALGVVVKGPQGRLHLIRVRRGVVLAHGGFAADRSLLKACAPSVASLPVDSQPGNTGEMTVAAAQVGAALVNMDSVECVPGSRRGINYPIRLDYMPGRMIMVNAKGERFVDEESSRAVIAAAILRYGDAPCWAVADAQTVAAFDGISQKNIYRGLYIGEAFREKSAGALAKRLGLDPAVFQRTLDTEPARSRIAALPLWAVQMHLRVHATLGGIRINQRAEALDERGRSISRLWACGACTGNVHGKSRIGGNGINTAVVFGRKAGAAAAKMPPIF